MCQVGTPLSFSSVLFKFLGFFRRPMRTAIDLILCAHCVLYGTWSVVQSLQSCLIPHLFDNERRSIHLPEPHNAHNPANTKQQIPHLLDNTIFNQHFPQLSDLPLQESLCRMALGSGYDSHCVLVILELSASAHFSRSTCSS